MKRALLFCLAFALPAFAQDSALFPRFSVTAGAYRPDFSTDVRVNDPTITAEATEVNLERDLGLEKSQRLQRFGLQWRPLNRHELAVSYVASSRTGFEAIDREITFRDTVYPVQAQVATTWDMDRWEATYTWWMRKTPREGFGVMLGVSTIALDASLVANTPGSSLEITETASTDVPVALLGAQWRMAFSERVLAQVSAGALPRVELGDYSGQALTADARVEYRIARALGVGIAYNYFRIDGTVGRIDFDGKLAMKVSGAEAFVRLGF
ncbi:MAG TPA: hypothetical protein VN181_12325 [Thermoanaerobaculia bacterium]|nr:hypothetical protein [Thermoanaerobaculia bacterium]